MIWKDFPYAPDRIEVSSNGDIRTKDILVSNKMGMYIRLGKIVSSSPNKRTGYIHLNITGINECLSHRVVAITFIDNPENKPQVHHKNHIRTDNRVENLEWVDNSENQYYSFKEGNGCNKGDNHPQTKLTYEIVSEMRKVYKNGGVSFRELGEMYGMSATNACDIIHRKIWDYDAPIKIQTKKEYKRIDPAESMDGEIWYSHPYIGDYMFSNFDRLKSPKREKIRKGGLPITTSERIIKFRKNIDGYYATGIKENGKQRTVFLHRIKALIFIDNPEDKPYVNHINNDPSDNSLNNLEWSTELENLIHAISQGRITYRKGETHHKAILTEEMVKEIRYSHKNKLLKRKDLPEKYGVSLSAIKDILKRKNWKHI